MHVIREGCAANQYLSCSVGEMSNLLQPNHQASFLLLKYCNCLVLCPLVNGTLHSLGAKTVKVLGSQSVVGHNVFMMFLCLLPMKHKRYNLKCDFISCLNKADLYRPAVEF